MEKGSKKKVKSKKNKKVSRTAKITRRTNEVEETEHILEELTSGNDIEANILREKPVNEQQIQGSINENSEPNNTNNTELESDTRQKNNTTQLTNNRSSFIWNYLEKLTPSEKYKKRVKCLVPVISRDGEQPCRHIMGSDGSTGNFIFHLAKHNITRNTELPQNIENTVKSKFLYTTNNPVRKGRLDKKFVKDNQLLSIWDNEGF